MGISSEVKLPGWLKPANRLIIALQRLGLAVGTMHLISVPGRKSSKIRTTPVSPLTVDGQRYIVGGLERADWEECTGRWLGHSSPWSERGESKAGGAPG